MGYEWHLRQMMAARDLFQTSDLVALLAERGIRLSREQVYRLVTQPPQRMSMDTLVALCDILQCTPNGPAMPQMPHVRGVVALAPPTPSRGPPLPLPPSGTLLRGAPGQKPPLTGRGTLHSHRSTTSQVKTRSTAGVLTGSGLSCGMPTDWAILSVVRKTMPQTSEASR